MGDILWLDPGDRGTGMQIQYNYVILSRALFLEIFLIILCMSMCVISACKSAIVSPYTPAL